jgi:hypothetical protein
MCMIRSENPTPLGWLPSYPWTGLMKTEPTALAAGVESNIYQPFKPEASVCGSRTKTFSSPHP